jgi:hypothetical protein
MSNQPIRSRYARQEQPLRIPKPKDVWQWVAANTFRFQEELARTVEEVAEVHRCPQCRSIGQRAGSCCQQPRLPVIEVWRAVRLFPAYAVSSLGRLKRIVSSNINMAGTLLKLSKMKNGYLATQLASPYGSARVLIHRLVAQAFLGPWREGMTVNHKDGVKLNNDVENLEYCTYGDNLRHSFRIGLHPTVKDNGVCKLSNEEVEEIKRLCAGGMAQRAAAGLFNVSQSHVSEIVRGTRRAGGTDRRVDPNSYPDRK